MLTLHADGGAAMLKAAAEARGKTDCYLLGVTVLTSLEADEKGQLGEIGIYTTPRLQALRMAKLSRECGLDGVVCSGHELDDMKHQFGDSLKLVVPGVRLGANPRDDQARVITPRLAAELGADYIVVGRPITGATDPLHATMLYRAELEAGASLRAAALSASLPSAAAAPGRPAAAQ
jgi:orotidine-5'-phosphate decarboxylase